MANRERLQEVLKGHINFSVFVLNTFEKNLRPHTKSQFPIKIIILNHRVVLKNRFLPYDFTLSLNWVRQHHQGSQKRNRHPQPVFNLHFDDSLLSVG